MATLAADLLHLQPTALEKFSVFLAQDEAQKRDCYRLRYNVFASEMGANVRGAEAGIDKDEFDDHCMHLIVRDNQLGEIIATTRLLTDEGRTHTGSFYSETEFDLRNILNEQHRFMEVGRTCIHPDYRRGAVLAILWQGIARIVLTERIDYLMGCASIQLSAGDRYLHALMQQIREKHFAPESQRVRPFVPLRLIDQGPMPDNIIMPTLLKGYLRQGAVICGEPYLDMAFGVADVFVLLDCKHVTSRYARHFLDRSDTQEHRA